MHGCRREKIQEKSEELGPPLTDLWHAPMKHYKDCPRAKVKHGKKNFTCTFKTTLVGPLAMSHYIPPT